MRLFIIIGISVISLTSFAQSGRVSGRVLDAKTLEPLPFTNVFINNTTIGAPTDTKGEFMLTNVPVGNSEIIFSFVGYQPYQTRVHVQANEEVKLVVKLIAEEKNLESVEVTSKRDKEWDNQLIKFEKIFLGTTSNSTQCKIVNPWVLDFTESSDALKPLFTASASQPLEINNLALGYRILFYLKDFKAGAQNYSILGNMRFEEMQTNDLKMADRWTKNRRTVYDGSDRHLFKSIIDGQVKEQGFQLYTDKPGYESSTSRSVIFSQELGKSLVKYGTDNIVSPGKRAGEYRIKLKGRIEIHYLNTIASKKVYRDVPYPIAWMDVENGIVDVNAQGVPLNSVDIVTSGYMSTARVADMLPFDYQPTQSAGVMKEDAWSIETLKFKRLQEKVYLHTDKPYYYGGEIIWFKGYLHYTAPYLYDSLSRVLYVELIDPERKIIDTRILPIDSGRAAGEILLSDTLKPGNYFLRGYTQWMMNYPAEEIFFKSIPILPLSTFVDSTAMNVKLKDSLHHVIVRTNADVYKTREKIVVTINVADAAGIPLKSDLSVSITDMNQVRWVNGVKNILEDYYFKDELDLKVNNPKLLFPIDYGISFSGIFSSDKGKPEQTDLTVIQGKMQDMVTVTTNDEGYFWLNGFQFRDTVSFSFQAKNSKGKPYGKVKLLPRTVPGKDFTCKDLILPTRSTTDPQRYKGNYQIPEDARILDEVIVSSTVINEERTKQAIVYGEADYVVKGDALLNASGGNLVPALQGRIPGLQVVPFWDETGIQRYKIRIRGGSSTFGVGGTTEPLLLIDGVPVMDGGFIADQIAAINPSNVERVEVITRANPLFGVRGTNGVIAIYTKSSGLTNADNSSIQTDAKFQTIPVIGYSQPLRFYSPDYSNEKEDHAKPDFRSTIFWKPWVNTDKKGNAQVEFYTADLPTEYCIIIEGITEDGHPLRHISFVTVRNP